MPGRPLLVLVALTRACVPPCQFDGADPECVVYGQLGDGELIPWHRASQACLDQFKIKDQAVEPGTLKRMFPNADGTNGNPTSFVNWLRFEGGQVVDSIKASFPQIFDASGGLRDAITLDGVETSCADSESACWTAVREWFAAGGADEMADVGTTLWARQASSREKEQVLCRIRLCSDGDAGGACEPLSAQVMAVKSEHPDKFCSAFGLGPGGRELPACAGSNATNTTDACRARVVVAASAIVAAAALL